MPKKKTTLTWPLQIRVEIEWIDACSIGGWNSMDRHKKEGVPTTCRTIGYLLEYTSTFVSVAQSQSSNTGNIAEIISIPRKNVRKMIKLSGMQ